MPVLGHQFHLQKREASKQEIIDLTAPLIQHALQKLWNISVDVCLKFPEWIG